MMGSKSPKKLTPKRTDESTCALLIWGVPRKLKRKFKAQCIREGRSMKDAVIDLLGEYVREDNEGE